VNVSNFRHFLCAHQYALYHDFDRQLFSNEEIALIHCAFESLQKRHDDSFYDEIFPFLGPLLSRSLFKMFEKTPPLPADFSVTFNRNKKGWPRERCMLEQIRWVYFHKFYRSWIHELEHLHYGGQAPDAFYLFHAEKPNRFLKEDFLFCRRYIDDFKECDLILRPVQPYIRTEEIVMKDVAHIRKVLAEQKGISLLEKRCLQAILQLDLCPGILENRIISYHTFRSLLD
jgi:hypothetical protein